MDLASIWQPLLVEKTIEDDVTEDPVASEEIEEKDPLKYFSEMEND